MGAEGSKAPAVVRTALRQAGEPLNTFGYPLVHEKVHFPPQGKSVRTTVCRCWKSAKFPLCDNTHQRLQKQGINVGPVMMELKPGVAPVGAGGPPTGSEELPRLQNLAGPKAAAMGGALAAVLAGGAHWSGIGII
eukprot:gnl/TRDRNA2_/TRDRNA2_42732_c0_seq1.p2 gnl/TRDRNA2_/TRDRNA2_42732_c0~~gnl/TRDRNA2_/TRDRNA2_42732_c0_seq1.p2  ORF type:complete len:135 (+),score=26.05 gnl/TRDRNA2_/TRDRNA2_42732_c0_seq1:78-482(+)